MSKTTTLILFYTGVAAICVGILCVVYLFIVPRIRMQGEQAEAFMNVGQQVEQKWFPIEKILPGEIRREKRSGCPTCAERCGLSRSSSPFARIAWPATGRS